MAGRKKDEIDMIAEDWARTRRELLGLKEPRFASEYLGAVRCTLSKVRDHHDGAASGTEQNQFFPEVYTGLPFVMNRCFHTLPENQRVTFDLHYGCKAPTVRKWQALGVGRRTYFEWLGRAKDRMAGFLDSAHYFVQDGGLSSYAIGVVSPRVSTSAG